MVVTVVGGDGGAVGGGSGEHGRGCPPGDAALDTCSAVWVQPAAPAIKRDAVFWIIKDRPGRRPGDLGEFLEQYRRAFLATLRGAACTVAWL
jgi:hypothetical protein